MQLTKEKNQSTFLKCACLLMTPEIQNKQFETILAIKFQKELMPISGVGEDAWK